MTVDIASLAASIKATAQYTIDQCCSDALRQISYGFERLMSNAVGKKKHEACTLYSLYRKQRTRTNHQFVDNMTFVLEGEITSLKMKLVFRTLNSLKDASIARTPEVNDGTGIAFVICNLQKKETLVKLIATSLDDDDERRIALKMLEFIVYELGSDDDIITKVRKI